MIPFATSGQPVTDNVDRRQFTNFDHCAGLGVRSPEQGGWLWHVSQVNPLMESSLPSLQPACPTSQTFFDEYRKPGFFQLLPRGGIVDSLSSDFQLPMSTPSFDQCSGLTATAEKKSCDNGKSVSVTAQKPLADSGGTFPQSGNSLAEKAKNEDLPVKNEQLPVTGINQDRRLSKEYRSRKKSAPFPDGLSRLNRQHQAKKERQRRFVLSCAFEQLKTLVPDHYLYPCSSKGRLSRLRILTMATRYIGDLSDLLQKEPVVESSVVGRGADVV